MKIQTKQSSLVAIKLQQCHSSFVQRLKIRGHAVRLQRDVTRDQQEHTRRAAAHHVKRRDTAGVM